MADSDDDLEALFDEVAAQRLQTLATTAPAPPAMPAATEGKSEGKGENEAEGEAAADAAPVNQADKPMYERLGGIVRLFHDSLRELGYDRSLTDVASKISDAQGRLEYIATLTEQAAHKVLNAIDIGLPQQEEAAKQAQDIEARWTALFEGKLSIEEFKKLAGDSKAFASKIIATTDAEKARLLEIMMAQDFQDLTGQLIKKIVTITHTVEQELAQLLRDNAPPEAKAAMSAAEAKTEAAPVDLMEGPSVPSAAMAQDDVDSLLDDLGF